MTNRYTKFQVLCLLFLLTCLTSHSSACQNVLNLEQIEKQLSDDPCSLKQVLGDIIKQDLQDFQSLTIEHKIVKAKEKIEFFTKYLKKANDACQTKLNTTQQAVMLSKGKSTFHQAFESEISQLKNSNQLFHKLLKFKDQIKNGFKLIEDITYNYKESCHDIFKIFGKSICERAKKCTEIPVDSTKKVKKCQKLAQLKSKYQFCQEYGQTFDEKYHCFLKLKLSRIRQKLKVRSFKVKNAKKKTNKEKLMIQKAKERLRKKMEQYRICRSCLKKKIVQQKMIMEYMYKQVNKLRMLKYEIQTNIVLKTSKIATLKKYAAKKKHKRQLRQMRKVLEDINKKQELQMQNIQKQEDKFNAYIKEVHRKEDMLAQLKRQEKNEILRLQSKTKDLKLKLIKAQTQEMIQKEKLEKNQQKLIMKHQDAIFEFKSRIIIKKEHMIHHQYLHKIWQKVLLKKKSASKFDKLITPKTSLQEKKKINKEKQRAVQRINREITTLKIQEKLEVLNLTAQIDGKLNLKRKLNLMSIRWIMRKIEQGLRQIQALGVLCEGASESGLEICKDQVDGIHSKINSLKRKVWRKLEQQQ